MPAVVGVRTVLRRYGANATGAQLIEHAADRLRHSVGSTSGVLRVVHRPRTFVEYFMCDMPDTVRALIDEQELKSLLPMTLRQIRTLRLAGQIPYLKVNRRTF